jgi:putative transposase
MNNINRLFIGMEFTTYGKLREFLELEEKTGVPLKKQKDELNRFIEWECVKYKCIITKIYDNPLPSLDNYFYKTITMPVKCNKTDYEYLLKCNKWSADVWNYCVEKDNENYDVNKEFLTRNQLQTLVKGCTPLHANGNQYIYMKYYVARDAMFKSRKANHENSHSVRLPYKEKKYMPTGWNQNCMFVDYEHKLIKLARKIDVNNKSNPVICYCKTIPKYIVEVELIYKNGLYLAIKYKEPKINENIISNNSAAIDLGEIHSITSIDNNGNAIIITGRKLREIKRYRNKEMGKLKSQMTKYEECSNNYNKYNHAFWNLKYKIDRQINDCVHKISKLYLDYCLENNISKVYYGDLDSCTRNTKGRINKIVGQKLSQWNYGELMQQLHNKLERYGIQLIKVSEAYTSQTCPSCGKRHKPTNRNYICDCGYTQHRDLVGAINILNFNEGTNIKEYTNLKYLRIE